MKTNKQHTLVDFFCGAGGFTEGFRQMGFETVYGYDHWRPAVDTYNQNYDLECAPYDISKFFDSIEEINNIPNTRIVLGSPPCVSFSNSNKSGKGEKGLGMKLIKSFLRIIAVKKHQPNSVLQAWFMENVANSKKYLQIYYTFEDLNLSEWAISIGKEPQDKALVVSPNTTIINSADYGSHQSRKRSISGEIISVGKFVTPEPTHDEKNEELIAWKTLGQLMAKLPSPSDNETNGNLIDPVYPSLIIQKNQLTDHFYDSGLYESEWRQSRELKTNHYCMGKMSFPENIDKPSRTVTATKSGTSREGLTYKSERNRQGNGEYRSPTIREIASLMGFPITYQFTGNLYAKWRQVGNAVCPSVSRALAKEVLIQNGYTLPQELNLQHEVNLNKIINLNTFSEAEFNNPPKRVKGSKYRRHPIKDGNLTVTLSNFDIKSKEAPNGKWKTSIQYGTGIGFKHQIIEDGFYLELEQIIKTSVQEGEKFIKIINNGFSEQIATSALLQKMYEEQKSEGNKREPTYLMDDLKKIINDTSLDREILVQELDNTIFLYKEKIPMRQLLALYGVNKIASIANDSSSKDI
ncbi:DNA (cytosine-5-)-methyltransferase [Pedobacter sp. LMG 31464]|uniref:DNA (cytosine-5-)-methyltransferase n=1 Tax=Pedobacter planticolens TaxID=2679964 RepID=A0A923DWY1_9SPHI|nr:DNA (cytosine-5-)-methyltransferase [Pedobacter planticolens]MBB2144581.1 DNA (cytosine-5-)-methyltransferase [Pedobacter planticolens]